MRASLMAAAAVMLGALTACGGSQPKQYEVAVDDSPLLSLPVSCYRPGNAPTTTVTSSNGATRYTWLLWDGPDNTHYLDVGGLTINLGNANAVTTTGGSAIERVIAGGTKVYTGERTVVDSTASTTDDRLLTVTFKDTPGDTAKGTLDAKSTYTCSGCNQPSCEAVLNFTARRIDAAPQMNYTSP